MTKTTYIRAGDINPEEVEHYESRPFRAHEVKLWRIERFGIAVGLTLLALAGLGLIFEAGIITSQFIN